MFCKKWGEGIKWEDKFAGGPHEANFLKLDCSKLKTTFGWKPRWDVETAVEKTVEWAKLYVKGENVADCMDNQIKAYFSIETSAAVI